MAKMCFFKGFVIALITQFTAAELSPSVESSLRTEMKSSESITDKILQTLKTSDLMKPYEVKGLADSATESNVFQVTKSGEDYLAKVVLDKDKNYKFCRIEKADKNLHGENITYANALKGYQELIPKLKKNFYSCVLILESPDTDLTNKELFSKKDEKGKIENSKILFRFFGKVIQAFAEMNFKAKILHGDIRPENIKIKFKKISNTDSRDFEPLIVNFGLILINKSGKEISIPTPRYAVKYRPPEIYEATNINGHGPDYCWSQNWSKFTFSKEFVEDVYVLGKVIDEVLSYQNDFISENTCEIKALKATTTEMLKKKEKAGFTNTLISNTPGIEKIRKNMKEIFQMFLYSMKVCNPAETDFLNQQFIKEANKSLSSLLKNIVII